MSPVVIPVSKSALGRAEMADPNSQRCLIENVPRSGAVEVAHVFDRQPRGRHTLMSIEWAWAMREGSLNLDTRQNIFFVGSSMHELYKDKRWALLPDEDMVENYHSRIGFPRRRADFVDLKGDTFRYRLVALRDMEDIYITRQTTDGPNPQVTVHQYPFEDLPFITSHVHPRYVILHLGDTLARMDIDSRDALELRYPLLDKVCRLRTCWLAGPPSYSSKEASYKPIRDLGPYRDDGPCTPLRRIPENADQHHSPGPSESQSSGTGYRCHPPRKQTKRKCSADNDDDYDQPSKMRLLTSIMLQNQETRDDLRSVKWTSQRIITWAEDCLSDLPQLIPIEALLRKSARIKDMTQRELL